jgi:hypothetical protein
MLPPVVRLSDPIAYSIRPRIASSEPKLFFIPKASHAPDSGSREERDEEANARNRVIGGFDAEQ